MPDRKMLQCATEVDFSLDTMSVRLSLVHVIFVYCFQCYIAFHCLYIVFSISFLY